MRLDLAGYGVLLAAGLGAAYWASLPKAEGEEEKVSIYSVDPKAVAEVTYETKEVQAKAVRREDSRYWIDHTRTETPLVPKDPKADETAAPPPAPEPKVTKERFLSNDKMDELLKGLSPLKAVRVIGKVDAAALKDFFGDEGPKDKVTFKSTDGKEFSLFLGKKSYGSKNRFAMEAGAGGRVVLVEDSAFENLDRAPQRMYERKLVSFELDDVTKAVVRAGDKTKSLSHLQRNKEGTLLWTDDEENAQPKPSYDSWMDKIAKLRLTGYAEPAEEETVKGLKPFLEVVFEKDGAVKDTLVFKKDAAEKPTYWIYSDFLKAHVKVGQARVEPIEKDVATILSDAKS